MNPTAGATMTQHRLRITFSDLDEVIQTAAGADPCLAGSSINLGICTHFDVVFKNDSPTLGNREKSICGGRKSKPFLPNPDIGINVNTCSHVGRFTCVVRWKRCYRAAPRMGTSV